MDLGQIVVYIILYVPNAHKTVWYQSEIDRRDLYSCWMKIIFFSVDLIISQFETTEKPSSKWLCKTIFNKAMCDVMWFHLTVLMNCLPHWFHVIHIFLNLHHTYSHTRSHSYICTRYALTKHQTHNLSECIVPKSEILHCKCVLVITL